MNFKFLTVNYFGKNLRYLRERNNLTQEDMEPLLNISNTRCSNYETGVSKPPIDVLIRISKYFEVSMDELLLADLSAQDGEAEAKPAKHKPYIINNAAGMLNEQSAGLHYIVRELKKLRKEVDAIKKPGKRL